jgi:8-oxo-dGTP diphosphatase
VFGRRVAEATYVRRPSVYAVITNGAGQVAVVRTAQGVFLPGGGIERGETPEQAVLREALEECRLDIRLLSRLT